MNSENGNTLKYRVEQVEKCCQSNKEAIELVKFVSNYEDDIMELRVMQKQLNNIEKTQRTIMFTVVGALITGLVSIFLKYLV